MRDVSESSLDRPLREQIADLDQQAGLGRGLRTELLGLAHARHDGVDRLDDEEEDRGGDEEEVDDVVDERAVAENAAIDRERLAAEVDAADHADDRRDQVVDERLDDRGERDAQDERDRQLDEIASQQELAELLEHDPPPGSPNGLRRRPYPSGR